MCMKNFEEKLLNLKIMNKDYCLIEDLVLLKELRVGKLINIWVF